MCLPGNLCCMLLRQQQRKTYFYDHTERLAIAFRFIITNPGTPTHITDDLHLRENVPLSSC